MKSLDELNRELAEAVRLHRELSAREEEVRAQKRVAARAVEAIEQEIAFGRAMGKVAAQFPNRFANQTLAPEGIESAEQVGTPGA